MRHVLMLTPMVVLAAVVSVWAQANAQGNLPLFVWEQYPGQYFYIHGEPGAFH